MGSEGLIVLTKALVNLHNTRGRADDGQTVAERYLALRFNGAVAGPARCLGCVDKLNVFRDQLEREGASGSRFGELAAQ